MPRAKASTESAVSPLALTPQDVERLLSPAASNQAKADVTIKIAASYAKDGFDTRESAIAEQIFRLLVRDTEVTVRAMLAERLKVSRGLPRDIALAMVRDVAEVALPMLRYSEVLTDDDLVTLIRETDETDRHLAVSGRARVGEHVSAALIETGAPEVAETLLANNGATLSSDAFETLFMRFGDTPAVMQSLAGRAHLPIEVAEKVVARVSADLARGLRKKYSLSPLQMTAEEVSTRASATLALLGGDTSDDALERLTMQLAAFNRLTPALILSALAEGEVRFFEASLARRADISIGSARKLVHDRGGLGLRALYNKSGLPAEQFEETERLLAAAAAREASA